MGIRKPSVSVAEAKRLAKNRAEAPPSALPSSGSHASAVHDQPLRHSHGEIAPVPALHSEAVPTLARPAAIPKSDASDDSLLVEPIFPEEQQPEPKVQVFLSVPLPAPGVSTAFDKLCRSYPAPKALQMVLRRALDMYCGCLDDGSYRFAATRYTIADQRPPFIVQTSRMIPIRLVTIARRHFDPLGFESTRAFGRKLASAALANYFEAEKKP